MINSTKWVALMAALGWAVMDAGEATAQDYYGYQPVGGASRYYSPVAPNWLGGRYQLPGWFNNSTCPVGYLGGNRQAPAYSYPAGNRSAPSSLQPVVPDAGFFSISDPYQQQPSSGWTPPIWPGNSVPAFQSPFYNNYEAIVPASVIFPANPSGKTETFPVLTVPARPTAPSPASNSPFYR